MKKWIVSTLMLFLICPLMAESPCRTIPYAPVFGLVGDTSADARQWTFLQMMDAWQFRKTPADELNLFFMDVGLPPEYFQAVSPCLELTPSAHYRLEMGYQGLTASKVNQIDVYLSYKNGANWVVDLAQLPKVGRFSNLLPGIHPLRLDFQAPSEQGSWALMFVTSSGAGQGDFVLTQIKLKSLVENDIQLLAFESPNHSCELNQKTISLSMQNNGSLRTKALEVCYRINQQTPVCQSFSGPFKPDTTYLLSFGQKVNFTQEVSTMSAFIRSEVKDEDPSNDSLLNRMFHQTPVREIPYQVNFSSRDDFSEWTVVNPNSNRSSWSYANEGVQISTASSATNDLLISPCLTLKKGQLYRIRVDVSALANSKGENLRVLIGKSSDRQALKQVLLTHKDFTNIGQRQTTCFFTPDEDTQYHLAFLACSEALRSGIRIDNIFVEPFQALSLPAYRGFESFESTENLYVLSPTDSNWFYYPVLPFAGQSSLRFIPDNKRRSSSWFSSSPLHFEAGVDYKFSYAVKLNDPSSSERLRVYVASTSDLEEIIKGLCVSADSTSLSASWKRVTKDVKVDKSGTYFLFFEYTNTSLLAKGISIDELAVYPSHLANNVKLVRAVAPSSSCSFADDNRKIELTLKNFSEVRQNDLVFYYQINQNPVVTLQPVSSISANALLKVDLSNLNLADDSIFKIRAWVKTPNDLYPGDDSSTVMTVRRLNALKVPIYNSFETEADMESWPLHGVATSWSRIAHSAQQGQYALYARSGIQVGDASIVTPCMDLDPTRTQMLTFFYKGHDINRPEEIDVRMGERSDALSRSIGNVKFSNTDYKRYVGYFRPQQGGTTYLSLNHHSPASNSLGGVYIDNLMIADSADMARPDYRVNALEIRRSNTCDLSPDTLVLSFENAGFFEIKTLKVRIQKSSGAILEETLNLTVQPETKIVYRLQTTWLKNSWDLDSVRVYFVGNNVRFPADDTSAWVRSNKIPVQTLPFYEDFNTAETRRRWNGVATNFWEQLTGPNDHLWFLSTGSSNGLAYASTHTEGSFWLIGPCVRVDTLGQYLVSYHYAATDATKPETMIAYLVDEQGVKDTIAKHHAFTHTVAKMHHQKHRILKPGIYRMLFYAPGALGRSGVTLDKISWRGDTLTPVPPPVKDTIIDIAMLKVLEPHSGQQLGQETLRYSLQNKGNVRIAKTPVAVYITYHKDTVPPSTWGNPILLGVDTVTDLDSGRTVEMVFSKAVNLNLKGSYLLHVLARHGADRDRTNDTLRQVIIHGIRNASLPELNTDAYRLNPNPADDQVSIEGPEGVVMIEVFTLSGQRVYHQRQRIPARISIETWNSGLYIIRIDGRYGQTLMVK